MNTHWHHSILTNPSQCQAIIWTYTGILSTGLLENFSQIKIDIQENKVESAVCEMVHEMFDVIALV